MPDRKHSGDPLANPVPVCALPVDSTTLDAPSKDFLRRCNVDRHLLRRIIVGDTLESTIADHAPGTVNRRFAHRSDHLFYLLRQILRHDQNRAQSPSARELSVLGEHNPTLNPSTMCNLCIIDLEIERVIPQRP